MSRSPNCHELEPLESVSEFIFAINVVNGELISTRRLEAAEPRVKSVCSRGGCTSPFVGKQQRWRIWGMVEVRFSK